MTQDLGLKIKHIEEGTGAAPQKGDYVSVHYVGTLLDGTEFDNSHKRGEPFEFPIGEGRVIKGWDVGIAQLKVGGKARLIVPPEMAYGTQGAGGVIPPNATLVFEVELVDVKAAPKIEYIEIEEGSGAKPQRGQKVAVHYVGTLADGTEFDNSLNRGQPIQFQLGVGRVIPGWDQGIALMREGGKATLIIPPELAYGKRGSPGAIPPNATLTFDVELVKIG
ncbi:MAG TPA: FKBP-type peptidyl-prolyl cis-trans isomerase [Anaerolineae bacterium]|nr:FKBP-type peptidyl-prolyl cis-trans isomerase [Anaerolineae bacterium]